MGGVHDAMVFVHDVMGCMHNFMGSRHDIMGSMHDFMGIGHSTLLRKIASWPTGRPRNSKKGRIKNKQLICGQIFSQGASQFCFLYVFHSDGMEQWKYHGRIFLVDLAEKS